jgi:putative transposase
MMENHRTSDGNYGSPRNTADIRAQGIIVTQKTVAKVINDLGIAGISPRSFVVKTTITKSQATYPRNRVKWAFRPTRVLHSHSFKTF